MVCHLQIVWRNWRTLQILFWLCVWFSTTTLFLFCIISGLFRGRNLIVVPVVYHLCETKPFFIHSQFLKQTETLGTIISLSGIPTCDLLIRITVLTLLRCGDLCIDLAVSEWNLFASAFVFHLDVFKPIGNKSSSLFVVRTVFFEKSLWRSSISCCFLALPDTNYFLCFLCLMFLFFF